MPQRFQPLHNQVVHGENPLSKERQEPIHLVAEVLDPENVSHATAAGAEEVIETHRLDLP